MYYMPMVTLRVSAEEKAAWIEKAGGSRKLSAWMRERLNRAAEVLPSVEVVRLPREVLEQVGVSIAPVSPSAAERRGGQCPSFGHGIPGKQCGLCGEQF